MDPITLPPTEGAEVVLGKGENEVKFHTIPPTRSLAKKLEPLWEKYRKASTDDENVDALADVIGARLANSNGSRKTAAAVLKEMWRKDELTFPQLLKLHEDIVEADSPN